MNNLTVSVKDNPDHLSKLFESNGILVVPDFVSSELLERLNAEISDHYTPIVGDPQRVAAASTAKQGFDVDVISWDPLSEGSEAFAEFAEDPRLKTLTSAVIGSGYSAPRSLVMWSVGGGSGQAWHQDCPPDDPRAFNVNRLLYVQDTKMEDGAIVIVPGSHRSGRIPPGGSQDPIEGEVALTPAAGTLVLLHGHVFHRVTPNRSGKPRVSVNLRAYPAGITDQVNRIGVYRNGAYDFADAAVAVDSGPPGG